MTLRRRIFSCTIPPTGAGAADSDDALLFPYWSFSKTIIAICAIMLAENGRISLDDPVRGSSLPCASS